MPRVRPSAALAGAALLIAPPAFAHVIAGARVFPVTLTFDDPGVGDEVSIPAFDYTRSPSGGGTGPGHEVDLGFEWDKTITENTALILNDGYDIQQMNGAKTQTGWENLVVTGKWQAYTSAAHEFVASLGLSREIGGTGTTHTGGDRYGSTTPNLYIGKGLGDLPAPALRPFAVTGELSYTIADKGLKAMPVADPDGGLISRQLNNGNPNAWFGGLSLQYSLPYLQSQVHDFGLPGPFAKLIPVVEFNWSSPASHPSEQGTSWTAAPGVIWLGDWGEVGLEATIPMNRAAGTTIGVVGLVHLFFDDLYPTSLGKPIF